MKWLITIFFFLMVGLCSSQTHKYYFDIVSGNDANTSTQAQNQATPWRTLNKLNSFWTSLVAGDSVLLKAGDVFPGFIRVTKSGTAALPINIGRYSTGANPIISGYVSLSGWTSLGGNLYSVVVTGGRSSLNMVTINGVQQPMGRYPKLVGGNPNSGYLTVTSTNGSTSITSTGISGIPNFVGGQIVNRKQHWILDRDTVLTQVGTTVTFTNHDAAYAVQAGWGFFFQNHVNACTTQGDWAYNGTTHTITMYSATGAPTGVNAAVVDSLVNVGGFSYITFNNLTFTMANSNDITFVNASHITVNNCQFTFTGINAIDGTNGTTNFFTCNNSILNNVNNNGFAAHFATNWILQSDTIINHAMIGGMGQSSDGQYDATLNIGANSKVHNCVLGNLGFMGIYYTGSGILIDSNYVHDFCQVKDDGGGIYTYNQNDTLTFIQKNIVLNGIGAPNGTSGGSYAEGLYCDDNTRNPTFIGNSVANGVDRGIYLHNASGVTLRNNISYNNKTTQIDIVHDNVNPNPIRLLKIYGNNFFAKQATQLCFRFSTISNDVLSYGSSDSNYFARPIADNTTFQVAPTGGAYTSYTLAGWQTYSSQDAHSKKSPATVTDTTQIIYTVNPTLNNLTTTLNGFYIDVQSNAYPGSITNLPYTSTPLIFQSNIVSLGVNITQGAAILCNGGTTTLTANVTGGVVPYVYLWSTGATTSSISGVVAGTYTVKVTDANNTVANAAITVSQPAAIVISSVNYAPITINGNLTSDTINAFGGTGTLLYSQNGSAYQSANVFNNVPAGNYTDSVKDANGCKQTYSFTITQPSVLVVTSTQGAAILCNGGTTTDTVKASGGTAPYTGTGINTVHAGTFTYTVTDAAGAQKTTTITITQPTAITISEANTTITINGGTSTVTITASGGTGALQYKLGSGAYQGSNVFTGVLAGTYTVTVKDANSCTNAITFTITQPTALVVTVTSGTILCSGGTTTDTVTASGGTPPYTGTGVNTVAVGSYSYTVTDAGGATATGTITISQPAVIQIALGYGSAPTTVTVTASGGVGSYMYQLDAGSYQSSNMFLNVGAGNHIIIVKDANNCTSTKLFSVNASLSITASTGTILCNGGTANVTIGATGGTAPYTGTGTFTQAVGAHTYNISDNAGHIADTTITLSQPSLITMTESYSPIVTNGGSTTVTINASGGTGSYTYSLDGGAYQGSNSFAGVLAGNHTITTKDANNCTQTASFTITQPGVLQISVSPTSITCYGGTSTVTISGSGGTAPLTVIGGSPQTKSAGTYTFSVTDAFNNRKDTIVTIVQPSAIVVTVTTGTITMNGGTTTVTASASGGTGGLQYKLDGGSYQGSGSFSGVSAGLHSVTVKDGNNCTQINNFSITQPGILYISVTVSSINCYGGTSTVVVSASGGTAPYTGTGTFTKSAGTYTFNVTDTFGATHDTIITIFQPKVLSIIQITWQAIITVNGTTTLNVSATGGTGTIQYKLDGGSYQMSNSFASVSGGNHTVSVQDANGCTISQIFTIPTPAPTTDLFIRTRGHVYKDYIP